MKKILILNTISKTKYTFLTGRGFSVDSVQGCTFFMKILVIGWLAKKYEVLLRKNANIRVKRWKNGEKGKFSLNLEEKMSFLKKRG